MRIKVFEKDAPVIKEVFLRLRQGTSSVDLIAVSKEGVWLNDLLSIGEDGVELYCDIKTSLGFRLDEKEALFVSTKLR